MLNVYNIHNVVMDKDESRPTHRNCLDYREFEEFLTSESIKFDKLKMARAGRSGSILTIDDATMGAFDAAMLCAAYKQYTTIFVNPYYIENGVHYHMHYLSQYIEDLRGATFIYDGQSYDTSKFKHWKKLRKAIKEKLCSISLEKERISYLEDLFGRRISSLQLPYHLRTMTMGQMRTLIENKYIQVEYHGWTHADPSSLSIEKHLEELALGQEWFIMNVRKDIKYFALPFGKRDARLEKLPGFPVIVLEDKKYSDTLVKHRVINRRPFESFFEQWQSERTTVKGVEPRFSPDGNTLLFYPPLSQSVKYTIPDSVTVIGRGSFNNCRTLKEIVIPPSVRVIQRNAFAHTALESVYIPDSVEEIGDLCFYSCKSLQSIRMSESLVDLGDAAFSGCESLVSISLPNSLRKLGDGLFMGCKNLKTVILPSAFRQLRDSVFIDCPRIPEIRVHPEH